MKISFLFKLLIISVLIGIVPIQNAFSMVESKTTHQVDSQHLQSSHSHEADIVKSQQLFDEDNHLINDCHHCGHCSGFHLTWLALNPNKFDENKPRQRPFYNLFQFENGFYPPLLRPPIS